MPEIVRVLGLMTALPAALVVLAIGIAQVSQTSQHNWVMFIIGGVLFILTVPPLLLGSSGSSGRTTSDRGAKGSVPGRAG